MQKKFDLGKVMKAYGGDLRKKAKGRGARPLCTKRSIHLVLRSTDAVGAKSFLRNRTLIDGALRKMSLRFGVKIYRMGNAGNHLHLLIKLSNRFGYAQFIRGLTGTLALKLKIKWNARPYSKIIEWGRHFKRASAYVNLNELEGAGVIEYSKDRLKRFALQPFSYG